MELVFWCDLKDIVWVVVHVSYLKHLKVPGGCSVFLLVVCQERFPLILSADAASVSLLFPSHTCSVIWDYWSFASSVSGKVSIDTECRCSFSVAPFPSHTCSVIWEYVILCVEAVLY